MAQSRLHKIYFPILAVLIGGCVAVSVTGCRTGDRRSEAPPQLFTYVPTWTETKIPRWDSYDPQYSALRSVNPNGFSSRPSWLEARSFLSYGGPDWTTNTFTTQRSEAGGPNWISSQPSYYQTSSARFSRTSFGSSNLSSNTYHPLTTAASGTSSAQ